MDEALSQGCNPGDGEDPEQLMREVLWVHVRLCEVRCCHVRARSSVSCWGFALASEVRARGARSRRCQEASALVGCKREAGEMPREVEKNEEVH